MEPFLADPDVTLYQGEVGAVLAGLPDASVHCVVTSPPYLALRDYRVAGQIGAEATPAAYVARLVEVFRDVRRVLRPDGTAWVVIGDSYVEKNLVGVPWMLAFALRDDGWYLRAENVWEKPNTLPSSVTDRTTRSHEQVFMLTRSARYFYDGFAVQEDAAVEGDGDAFGRHRRSVWTIATEPNELAACEDCDAIFDKTAAARRHEAQTGHRTAGHFAAFPRELVRVCVAAGTSEHGCCSACGTPYRRVVEEGEPVLPANTWSGNGGAQYTDNAGVMEARSTLKQLIPRETVGWQPGCSCAAPVEPATVLDPFMGSGTTALVARAMCRRAVGVELRPAYCRMTTARLQQQSLFA